LISTRGENGEIKNCRSFFHGCKGSGCRIPTKSTDLQHSRAGQVVVVKKCENIVKLVTFISERRTIMDKQGKGLKIHVVILTKVPCLSPRIQLMSCSQSGGSCLFSCSNRSCSACLRASSSARLQMIGLTQSSDFQHARCSPDVAKLSLAWCNEMMVRWQYPIAMKEKHEMQRQKEME